MDCCLERHQPFVHGQQFDNRGPRIDEILERPFNPPESPDDLAA